MSRTIAIVGFALIFGLLVGYVFFGGGPLNLTGLPRLLAALATGLATGGTAVIALRR